MADAFSLGRTSKEDLIQAFKNAQADGNNQAAGNIAKAITNTSAPWNDPTRHNPNQQGSFGYGVDRAQQMFYKGVDSFGKLAGFEGVRDWSEAGYQQQVKDIEEGNYQPKYRKSLRDTYDEQGLGGGLGWLAEKSVENAASGGAALVGGGAATLAAFFSTPLAAILAGGTMALSTVLNAGETVMEIQDGGTEDYNSALTSGVGTVNGLLDMFGASKVFKSTGVSKLATQEIIEKLMKEGKEDAAEAVFKQFLKSQGMGAAVKTGVKKTVSEATTEMFQEANIVAAGALSGNEYTGDDLVDRALESFLLGGTNAAAITTAIDIAPAPLKKYFNPKTKEMFLKANGVQNPANVMAALRFQRIADSGFDGQEGKADPTDVKRTSSNGAVAIMDNAHRQIADEINAEVKVLKPIFKSSEQQLAFDVANGVAKDHKDIASAASGIKLSKNKTKSFVTNDQLDAIRRMSDADNNVNGEKLVQLIQESQVISKVHNEGLIGGVSSWTDFASPFSNQGGYSNTQMVNQGIQAVSTIGLGVATSGASLPYQGAIWLGGKIIDKATGNRSKLQKFIEANIDGEGFAEPTGKVDLRIQQEIDRRTKENKDNADRLNKGVTKLELAQQKIKDKDTSEMLYDAKVPPDFGTVGDENHNISPAGMMWSRLELANIVNGKYEPIFGKTEEGFDKATAVIDKAIDLTLQKYPDTFTKIAAEYKEKRRSGGRIGKEGTQEYANFLTAVKSERDQSSDQIPNSTAIPVAEDTTPTTPTLSTRQQMGKDENLAFLTKLKTTAKALPVSEVDIIEKAKLLGAMEQLGMNLGRGDRVNTALEIAAKAERDGVRQELIAEYLMPYIQRVEQQQNAQQVDNVSEIDESTSKNILVPIEEVSFQNNPMRVSPSRTEGAKKQADSFNTDRQISLDIIKSDPVVLNKISTNLQDKSVYSGIISNAKDDAGYLEDFVTHAKDNLIALHNGVSPVFRERAKQWYVGANTITRNIAVEYEIPEHAAAGVYAALSPQKDWYMNQELGHRLIDIHTTQMNAAQTGSNQPQVVFDDKMKNAMLLWMNDPKKKTSAAAMTAYEAAFEQLDGKSYAELPTALKAYWLRFYDEAYNENKGHRVITPEGGFGDLVLTSRGNVAGTGWNSFRDIRKGIEILLDSSRENIDRQLGEKHKVRSFYNNILDPMATAKDTTIDTHAVAAALLQPLSGKSKAVLQNFKDAGTSKSIGVFGSYGVYHEAYVRAAEELGLLPRELQSITWEAVRGLFSPAFKGQKANVEAIENIWKDYELGGISLEETRSRIYETAGGISPAAWEDNASRQRDGINESTRINPNAGALASIARSPSSEGDGRGATSGSPRVLPQPTKKLAPTNPIDVTQAKPFVRDAQSLMLIGKEGGRYENGIEIGDAYNLMDALNIVYRGVSSVGAISDAMKKTGKKRVNEDADVPMGFYRGNSTGTGGQVVALRQGTVKEDGTKVIPIEELVILFHEIAHGLENQVLNRELRTFKEVKNPLNGKMNFVRHGTFREHLFNHIMDDKGDAVIDEIMNLQTNIDIYQEANPSETYAVRPIREMYATGMKNFDTAMLQLVTENQPDVELTPESLKRWRTSDGYKEQQRKASKFVGEEISDFVMGYMHNLAEFAADPIWVYMLNPKLAKSTMPKTTKLIQKFFNQKDGSPVKFFGHPLATLVAIALATLAAGKDEEEQQKTMQIPQGALSPEMGMLSA